jgi:N-acetylneuraminic acid mutarotase
MKKLIPALSLCLLVLSCSKHDSKPSAPAYDNWTSLTGGFVGAKVANPTGFNIGGQLFIGMGIESTGASTSSFYQYDPINFWMQIPNIPIKDSGSHSVGFSIGGLGYVVMTPTFGDVGTLYSYQPASNNWNSLPIYPGAVVEGAVAFVINGKAYVGLGGHAGLSYNQLWQYDPIANQWVQKKDYPDVHSAYPAYFVIGEYAYVGTGASGVETSDVTTDFYRYDPSTDEWTAKANFPGAARYKAAGFSEGNYGYIGTGTNSLSQNQADIWQYDPSADKWTKKSDFPGGARAGALTFSGGSAFLGFGSGANGPFSDLWLYQQ